jgi:hypothetical protein
MCCDEAIPCHNPRDTLCLHIPGVSQEMNGAVTWHCAKWPPHFYFSVVNNRSKGTDRAVAAATSESSTGRSPKAMTRLPVRLNGPVVTQHAASGHGASSRHSGWRQPPILAGTGGGRQAIEY